MIIDTDEELRQAVRLAAVKRRMSPTELVNFILREYLAAEIEELREMPPQPEVPRKKRGRKPKGNRG